MIEIEEAISDHFLLVADIYNESIKAKNATMDNVLKASEDIAGWVRKFNDREKLFVLKEDGIVVGWAIIKRYSDREGYRFTCETAVYITAPKIGKGYGKLLKKHVIKVCKQLDYKHLVAKIFANNKASIAYNENLGYSIVGIQNQVGFKNNQWLDVVIMQYIIE